MCWVEYVAAVWLCKSLAMFLPEEIEKDEFLSAKANRSKMYELADVFMGL